MHHLSQVAVGKWILPGFDQGHQFSGCYLFTSRVDATEYSITTNFHLSSALTRPSLFPPLISYFWFLRWLKRWNKMLELKISQQVCGLNLEDEVLYSNCYKGFSVSLLLRCITGCITEWTFCSLYIQSSNCTSLYRKSQCIKDDQSFYFQYLRLHFLIEIRSLIEWWSLAKH